MARTKPDTTLKTFIFLVCIFFLLSLVFYIVSKNLELGEADDGNHDC